MARTKQTGPEVKLFEMDTMVYIGVKNVLNKLSMFSAFIKNGGVQIANANDINKARALERFDKNYLVQDILTMTSVDGQANETWLRKNGLLDSLNGNYDLSPIAKAIIAGRITLKDYCFLLLSKQWIKIKQLGQVADEYPRNLLAYILEKLNQGNGIPTTDFVTVIGSSILNTYKNNYDGLALSNQEAARYLIDPLLISDLIKEEEGKYVIREAAKDLVNDYLVNEEKLQCFDTVDCQEEEFWNDFSYGVYDIINDSNKFIYSNYYPSLLNAKANHMKSSGTYPLQQIFYGAPGTGKSHTVDDVAKVYKHHRITFHPDSDYSSFVGCYKPVMSEEDKDKIIYSFTPQAFTNAYIEAWELNAKKEPVFLVIEEINRGNCAQIFGDLFQLLDRKDDGYSKYEITPDTELQKYIAKQGLIVSGILDSDGKDISDKINSGELMKLPNNLHIWATMNTSDQSLFPIDSAFKRRWDWVYVPIEEGADKDTNQKLDWQIEADENHKPVSWWLFLQKINMIIADLTSSEDKQLGYFFCKPDKEDKKTISKERFVGKVLFYLWNDIFKDYAFDLDICKKAKDNKKVQYFANFYKKQNVIDIDALINFFEKLDSSQKEIDDKEVIIFTKKSADSAPEPVPTAPEE